MEGRRRAAQSAGTADHRCGDRREPIVHHVGGYPSFTQSDFREAGHYDDYDRTLLRLTSDAHIGWGDVGEAVFLIRRADLAARDFSRVAFSWDCH